MAEPKHVHRVFGVVPKLFDEFCAVHVTLTALAD